MKTNKQTNLCLSGICYLLLPLKTRPQLYQEQQNHCSRVGFCLHSSTFFIKPEQGCSFSSQATAQAQTQGCCWGCSSSSQASTDDTSPCLGALTSPSFRSAWHQPLWEIFSMCPSALAPAKQEAHTKSSLLVNRTAVLISSPIAGSSGPCAVTPFLQQADEEMSKEKLFSCLVYVCKKPFRQPNTYQPQKAAALFPLPAWCYQ